MGEFKLELKDIWNAAIFIAVGMILFAGFMIWNEYSSANDFCDGEIEYNFPGDYYCDTIPIYKYSNGWGYERELNLSMINKLILP